LHIHDEVIETERADVDGTQRFLASGTVRVRRSGLLGEKIVSYDNKKCILAKNEMKKTKRVYGSTEGRRGTSSHAGPALCRGGDDSNIFLLRYHRLKRRRRRRGGGRRGGGSGGRRRRRRRADRFLLGSRDWLHMRQILAPTVPLASLLLDIAIPNDFRFVERSRSRRREEGRGIGVETGDSRMRRRGRRRRRRRGGRRREGFVDLELLILCSR